MVFRLFKEKVIALFFIILAHCEIYWQDNKCNNEEIEEIKRVMKWEIMFIEKLVIITNKTALFFC